MTPRTSHARPRGRRRRSKGSAHAGPARKAPLVAGLTALAALTAVSLFVAEFAGGGSEPTASARQEAPSPADTDSPGAPSSSASAGKTQKAGADTDPPAKPPTSKPAKSPESSESSESDSSTSSTGIPKSGPGTFTTAGAGTGPVGGGRIVTYSVSVENGLKESAEAVATEVDEILADPRGWTADGATGFRRIAGDTADFVVQLATPDTVDRVCGEYNLDTGGEVNCNVGRHVMVNLKRWRLATPAYARDIPSYRALIVNHEVGHYLGHNHETCPGAGKPAPAMMQQIKGLRGCVINAWPYAADGTAITGPPVP
ncbi:DUF3152 domain-containing protein [Streptomyces sp. NPDC087851]|uniref:DUF3152 domain-containing protein n=1 Tax=Streptomyces sp. NPDC087851 TaxID=3365810 RepID=UPI0038105460